MDTKGASALLAFPSRSLHPHEIPYARLLDLLKVLDHAHAIFRAVSIVKVLEAPAWVLLASVRTEFEPVVQKDPALSYYAFSAMTGVSLIHLPAARASVAVPEIAQTYATVHSAGCNQVVLHSSSSESVQLAMSLTMINMPSTLKSHYPENGTRVSRRIRQFSAGSRL